MADDDDIYPTHFLDNSAENEATRIDKGTDTRGIGHKASSWHGHCGFNDVLDDDKLHDALWRLCEIGDWRKLGGRLIYGTGKSKGKLEVHVLKTFTKGRPPVVYTKETFDLSIGEHPVAKDLPSPTKNASLQRPLSDFPSLTVRPDAPTTLDKLVASHNVPQLSLHVVTFDDATLVSMTFPHALMDGMGLQGFLKSWSLVLAGIDDEVPVLLGAKDDLLHAAAADPPVTEGPTEEWGLKGKLLNGFAFFLFVVQLLWSIITERKTEGRTIFLPKATVVKLRRQAMEDIATSRDSGKEVDGPQWVSDGDVLLAWGVKMVAQAQQSPRPINAMSVMDLRSRLPEFATPKGVYVHSGAIVAGIQLSRDEPRLPLGLIAAKSRQALTVQATKSQVRSFIREARRGWDSKGDPVVLPGIWNGELFTVTNWIKGDFVHLADFSPAVVKSRRPGEAEGANNAPGQMVRQQSFVLKTEATMRNVIGIFGKDTSDDYWMMGYFPMRTWAVIEEEIRQLNEA